jgi:uncharacterized protein (TIGR03437 family)
MFRFLCAGFIFAATSLFAQPVISTGGVLNVASYAYANLPNSAIAQGSIFAIFGSALGPSSSPALAYPLPTTFGGVSIQVTQGSTTVAAIPVFVSAGQVNAIMPSNAPLGADTVTVSFNGQVSAPVTVQVAANNFGIFAINASGAGPAVVTDAQGQVIQSNFAATAGQTLVMYGTGLGAIASSDTQPPPSGNITANSPMVYVGGSLVTPVYHGRTSCCGGLDQINFVVPAGVAGCNVPVAVQIGNSVSNFTSIAVAASGSICTDPSGVPATLLSKIATSGSAAIGRIQYTRSSTTAPSISILGGAGTSVTNTQTETARFNKETYLNPGALSQILNSGACSVYTFNGSSNPPQPGVGTSTGLDAGSGITATIGSTQGNLTPVANTVGSYSAIFAFPAGAYTFAGAGGKDVGSFSANLQIPAAGFSWTNRTAVSPIQRANGLTVTWSGADPAATIIINGFSIGGSSTSNSSGAGFSCTAPAGSSEFTVPATVLLALPASASLGSSILTIPGGSVSVIASSTPVAFTASGLDYGFSVASISISDLTVTYR